MQETFEAARESLCNVSEPLYFAPQSKICLDGSRIVWGRGPVDADVVFVGSNPGRNENKTGVPFTGKAGKNLDKLCLSFGVPLDKVYVTNVLKLALFEKRQPTNDDIIRHTPWLQQQLSIIQPRLVVALGNVAAKALLKLIPEGTLQMTEDEESDIQIRKINARIHDVGLPFKVITTFNPVNYEDERYKIHMDRAFTVIHNAMTEERNTMDTFFKAATKAHIVIKSSMNFTSVCTKESIKEQLGELDLDEDVDQVYDDICEHFASLMSGDSCIEFQDIESIAEAFDISEEIAQHIANLVVSRKRKRAPPTIDQLSERSAKRSKPLDS